MKQPTFSMTLRVRPGSQQIGLAAEVMNSHAKIPVQKKQGMCVCAPDSCRFSCTIHTTPSCVSKYHGVQLTRSCFHPNVSTIRLTKDVFLVHHRTTKSSYSFEIGLNSTCLLDKGAPRGWKRRVDAEATS